MIYQTSWSSNNYVHSFSQSVRKFTKLYSIVIILNINCQVWGHCICSHLVITTLNIHTGLTLRDILGFWHHSSDKSIKGPHNSDKAIMQHNVMINAKTSIVDYRIIEPNMYNTYILYNIFKYILYNIYIIL